MVSISLIIELAKRDYTERFAGNVLGSVWALIWPLVNLFIYIIVFGKLMGGRIPGSSDIYSPVFNRCFPAVSSLKKLTGG